MLFCFSLFLGFPCFGHSAKLLLLQTNAGRMGDVFDRAIDLVGEGQVEVESMVTHTFDLADAPAAFAAQAGYKDGAIKTMIRCS